MPLKMSEDPLGSSKSAQLRYFSCSTSTPSLGVQYQLNNFIQKAEQWEHLLDEIVDNSKRQLKELVSNNEVLDHQLSTLTNKNKELVDRIEKDSIGIFAIEQDKLKTDNRLQAIELSIAIHVTDRLEEVVELTRTLSKLEEIYIEPKLSELGKQNARSTQENTNLPMRTSRH